MRKSKMFFAIGLFALAGLFLASCVKENTSLEKAPLKNNLKTNAESVLSIYMGQHTLVGEAFIYIQDQSAIRVDVVLNEGIIPSEAHLYAGEAPPPTSAPGQFPYHWYAGDEFPISFVIDISPYDCQAFDWYFALHLAIGNETAWILTSDGGTYWYNKKGKKLGWGQYFLYYFDQCEPG